MFHVPEDRRLQRGPMGTSFSDGNNGAFILAPLISNRILYVIASDGDGWGEAKLDGEPWEHVSIHVEENRKQRTPTWAEMCHVKATFWDAEDVVIQIHPAESHYVNNHAHTLHLWRPTKTAIPLPPDETVGLKSAGEIKTRADALRIQKEIMATARGESDA